MSLHEGRRRTEVEVRAIAPGDVTALRTFFEQVPEGDRTFFREDVLAPGVIERWLEDPEQQRLVAVVDGAIAGHGAVIRGVGWSRHVGEIRLVVGPEHRGRGLGRLLAQRAVVEAIELGLTKLVVDVVAEQEATVAMFTKLGFEAEGLFRDHVRDQAGRPHDLLVLAHFVDDLRSTMATAGIDEAVLGRELD
jgi:L-amino acid N-acyltransferase YncA